MYPLWLLVHGHYDVVPSTSKEFYGRLRRQHSLVQQSWEIYCFRHQIIDPELLSVEDGHVEVEFGYRLRLMTNTVSPVVHTDGLVYAMRRMMHNQIHGFTETAG